MKGLRGLIAVGLFGLAAVSTAQAGGVEVVCGDTTLGIRTTTVDPALAGSCYAGLTNLGDPALESLVNTEYGSTDATIIDRDAANTNGDELSITGVGGTSGGWSLLASLWAQYDRLFLYFHFGDSRDCSLSDCTGFPTDPDIFIVELVSPDSAGTWDFSGQQGLSNIALIGTGGPDQTVPEPATVALIGLSLLGVAVTRRRRRN